MESRRSMRHAVMVVALSCLCIFGSTKSGNAFDFSNSTDDKQFSQEQEGVFAPSGELLGGESLQAESDLISPPLPRNNRGQLVCTKNRYVQNERQIGVASWYGNEFHGRLTANGERFDQNGNTIAHLTLPMGTKVVVTNPVNGKSVTARVTDCGPYKDTRIADLSRGVAERLGIVNRGVGTVIITVL